MARVIQRFDSDNRQVCEYCANDITDAMVVEGIPAPGNAHLFIYHPACYRRLERSETLADYIEVIRFMNKEEEL